MTAHRFQESRELELSHENVLKRQRYEEKLTNWKDCYSVVVSMQQRSEAVLPFYDKNRWNELNNIISNLHGVKNPTELASGLKRLFQASGNSLEDLKNNRKDALTDLDNWPFSGLAVFLEEIADDDEREGFFETVLPFVLCLATRVEELAPKEGIPVGTQQNGKNITLDRKLVAALLATGFLCAFPPVPDKVFARSINFANFYAYFHRAEYRTTQAAKLRCFVHYFKRLEKDWPNLDGQITLIRQVITTSSVPTLDNWLTCPFPLCPVVVDHKNALENSGSYMLQVDFANRFIGGGVLGGGHVQEEIRFCVNPELVVSLLCMDAMDDNEAIIIKGAERFSSYRGYGKTFEFDGDFQDDSERDADGNLQTAIAAIDAKSFRNAGSKSQYEEHLVLRELNKALAGFYNADVGCKFLEKDESSCDCADQISREDKIPGGFVQPETKSAFDVLLGSAVSEAFTSATTTAPGVHNMDDEILIRAMRKSVIEVFQETPQKASAYLDTFLSPSTPKCMRFNLSGQNSPLVPSTPPSSPFVEGVGRENGSSFQIPCIPDTSLLKGNEPKSNSFADALYKSLLNCVKKTSSIADSIAVTALSPVKTAMVTKETFAKSPRDIGSPVKGGESLISFLSYTLCGEKVIQLNEKQRHGKDFVHDFATLIGSAKSKGSGKGDTNNGLPNVRQNLTLKFASDGSSEKFSVRSPGDLEEFANELARSLVDSGIAACVKSTASTQHAREACASMQTEEKDSAISDGETARHARVANDLVVRVLSAALAEAAGVITEDTVEFDLTGEAESSPVSSDFDSELERLSEDLSYERLSTPSDNSSDQEIVPENAENAGDVCEGLQTLADELSESILHSGMAEAIDLITEQLQDHLESLKERRGVDGAQDVAGENSSADVTRLADKPAQRNNDNAQCGTFATPMHKFAEDLCEATLSAGVQLAGARLRLRQSEAVVRPVATGNWGCGVFRGDPELKALVQWLAASAAGCPALVYHTFGDKRLSQLFKVVNILRSRDQKVCDVTRGVLRFCNRVLNKSDGDCWPSLSSALLEIAHIT